MKAAKVHRCKLHSYAHAYTVCPACSCQYCPEHWPACPRTSWHPAHGTTPADAGNRYNALRKEQLAVTAIMSKRRRGARNHG